MTDQTILAKITEIVRDELEDDSIVLTPETQAKQVPGWDSLAHVSPHSPSKSLISLS